MWREPTKADANKTALEKDSTAAARSSIGRRGRSYRARRSGVLASFHSQIINELRRGSPSNPTGANRFPARSPVLNNGMSEDGMTLEDSRREAFARAQPPSQIAHRRYEPPSVQNRRAREQSARNDLLGSSEPVDIIDGARIAPTSLSSPVYWSHPSELHGSASSPSSNGVRLPPLRRTDSHSSNLAILAQANMPPEILEHRSRPSRESGRSLAIDGLGDRQRSMSPDRERETDAWETLLSTITPDANLPSTDTSFASTSMSDSRNNAHPTYSSFPYREHFNPCDFSSSDDEDSPANYLQFIAPHGDFGRRRRDRNSTFSAHPPPSTVSPALPDSHRQSDEVQQMQVILDRLSRREDIPHDWWAAVGLTRTLNRGLRANMDSTDTEGAPRTARDH